VTPFEQLVPHWSVLSDIARALGRECSAQRGVVEFGKWKMALDDEHLGVRIR
jgi:hypothetical protein